MESNDLLNDLLQEQGPNRGAGLEKLSNKDIKVLVDTATVALTQAQTSTTSAQETVPVGISQSSNSVGQQPSKERALAIARQKLNQKRTPIENRRTPTVPSDEGLLNEELAQIRETLEDATVNNILGLLNSADRALLDHPATGYILNNTSIEKPDGKIIGFLSPIVLRAMKEWIQESQNISDNPSILLEPYGKAIGTQAVSALARVIVMRDISSLHFDLVHPNPKVKKPSLIGRGIEKLRGPKIETDEERISRSLRSAHRAEAVLLAALGETPEDYIDYMNQIDNAGISALPRRLYGACIERTFRLIAGGIFSDEYLDDVRDGIVRPERYLKPWFNLKKYLYNKATEKSLSGRDQTLNDVELEFVRIKEEDAFGEFFKMSPFSKLVLMQYVMASMLSHSDFTITMQQITESDNYAIENLERNHQARQRQEIIIKKQKELIEEVEEFERADFANKKGDSLLKKLQTLISIMRIQKSGTSEALKRRLAIDEGTLHQLQDDNKAIRVTDQFNTVSVQQTVNGVLVNANRLRLLYLNATNEIALELEKVTSKLNLARSSDDISRIMVAYYDSIDEISRRIGLVNTAQEQQAQRRASRHQSQGSK